MDFQIPVRVYLKTVYPHCGLIIIPIQWQVGLSERQVWE